MDNRADENLIDVVLNEMTGPLRRNDVRYMLVGAVAVMAHGAPRMTQDLDLRVQLTTIDRTELRRLLESTGHQVEGPARNEFGERYLVRHPYFLVEVYLAGSHPYIQAEFDRAVPIPFGSTDHPVISKEDLILRKLYNQRVRRSPFDQHDALALLSIHKRDLDLEYIRERARTFRLTERFESLWNQVRD